MTTIRLGFTGSRNGMTTAQMRAVYWHVAHVFLVHDNDPGDLVVEAHHGDCIGADAQFHVIATVLGCHTVAHPPLKTAQRAYCQADEIREPLDYLARDWNIVFETGQLLAAPVLSIPQPHSGTWITTGYAVQLNRPATVFLPGGGSQDGSTFGLLGVRI